MSIDIYIYMNNLTCFIIIIIAILSIIYFDHTSYLNKPTEQFDILSKKKFMLRDKKTRLWLTTGTSSGYCIFMPDAFRVPLLLSDNPNEYLPLRLLTNPNDYLLATDDKQGIRIVSNPYSNFKKLEMLLVYEELNLIGYIDESDTQYYLSVDSNGKIKSVTNIEEASSMEILFI